VGRRRWLAAAGAGVVGVPLAAWLGSRGLRPSAPLPRAGRFGAIRPDPRGVLDLLEGFTYRVIDRVGTTMSDGIEVPPRPDGMGCFDAGDGTLVLMRNHELPGGVLGRIAGGASTPLAYDGAAAGAVSRVVLDGTTFARRSSNLVLAGTSMNCSGGTSPWGWLSCEESREDEHGFVFLCDPAASAVQRPSRLDALGRFRHEAAAVDVASGRIYLSEDEHDGCLYRFVPHDRDEPFEGRLQALRVRGRPGTETRAWGAGRSVEHDWVELPEGAVRGTRGRAAELRHSARARGAAQFNRGEGITIADGGVYLCATEGGARESGQIFRLDDEAEGGTLRVVASSSDPNVMDMPDNVAPAPAGGIVFVEDGPDGNFIRGVTAAGEVFDLGRNAAGSGELTGVCFAPSGRAMFVNLQVEGYTLLVQGPFERLA
jgi:hypothetical protein